MGLQIDDGGSNIYIVKLTKIHTIPTSHSIQGIFSWQESKVVREYDVVECDFEECEIGKVKFQGI